MGTAIIEDGTVGSSISFTTDTDLGPTINFLFYPVMDDY